MELIKKNKERKVKHEIIMTEGPILSKMLMFAFPLMASSMLQILFNAADIVVVGRFAGDNSLAAVGSTTSLVNLMVTLFLGLSVGANVVTARYFGAQKSRELGETVHTAITVSLVSGAFLTVLGLIFAEPALRLMQSPETVIHLAALYLRIYFIGMPAMMIYNFGSAMLRAKGDTQRPLYYLALAGVINVTLNLIFVIVLHMDVAGVAAATVISQCVSAFLVVRCLCMEEGVMKLDLKKLKIHKQRLFAILQVGLPAGFQGILFSISNVLIQSAVNTYGDVAMAGNAASQNLEGFVYFGMQAFYQAAISFTSQNMGAGKFERIRPIMKWSMICTAAIGLVMGLIFYALGPVLLGIYSTSPDVIASGMIRMAFICAPYAICGLMDTMVGVLRGLGYSIVPMVVSLVGACLSRIVWISVLFAVNDNPVIHLVYASYPATWSLTLVAHCICYWWIMEHKIKPMHVKKLEREAELTQI
ncbi:MAG: MATE family efflux transporter [Firmicutes bacterium]|nr:MATE family efflux transporter [Bacillota bacterium]